MMWLTTTSYKGAHLSVPLLQKVNPQKAKLSTKILTFENCQSACALDLVFAQCDALESEHRERFIVHANSAIASQSIIS